ncbi:TPM domain-containing protein [Cellulosimicrobium terreum]|nr:TPM domain-containing protein [Cellulosimicrobium terreum]
MRTTGRPTRGTGRGRALRAVGALALLAAVGGPVALPDAASAVPPDGVARSVAASVTDPGGVLGDRADAVHDALARVERDTDVRLLVVLVPTFDGMDGVDWANATASASGLGTDDLLLAIATDEDRHGLSADTSGGLDADDLEHVRLAVVGPLQERDWAGAVIAAADAIRTVSGSGPGVPQAVLVGAGAVLLALVAAGVLMARRGRPRGTGHGGRTDRAARGTTSGSATATPEQIETLEARARAAFVSADDALRAAAEEAPPAAAGLERGGSPGPFLDDRLDDRLDAVRAPLARAAALLREPGPGTGARAPDAEPPGDRLDDLAQVEDLCAAATAALARRAAGRRLPSEHEADAPDDVDAAVADVLARAAAAHDTVAVLALTYHPAAFAPVVHNPDRAVALATEARRLAEQARETPVRRGAETGVPLRVARRALAQADVLLGAVVRAAFDLGTTAAAVQRGVRSLTADIADADRRAGTGPVAPTALAAARQTLTEVGSVNEVSDPTRALEQLVAAEAALDTALRSARDRSEDAARTNALLRETLAHARRRLTASDVVLTTRRGAVGPAARTRWWEASDLYAQALDARTTAPRESLDAACGALVAVRESLRLAALDVARWDARDGEQEDPPRDAQVHDAADALALGGIPGPAETRPRPRGPRRPAPA